MGEIRRDNREFIAADARHGNVLGHAAAQAVGDAFEQRIAELVPERVVDVLEVVEVEVEHREPAIGAQVGDRLSQTFAQQHAVGQIGQSVVMRHMRDDFLRAAALGDVFMGGYPAAAREGSVDDRDGAPVGLLDNEVQGLAARDCSQEMLGIGVRIARVSSLRFAIAQQIGQALARVYEFLRQAVEFDVTLIADHQPRFGIEHQQRLRHVVDGGVDQLVFLRQ